jgi:hypothetical protein
VNRKEKNYENIFLPFKFIHRQSVVPAVLGKSAQIIYAWNECARRGGIRKIRRNKCCEKQKIEYIHFLKINVEDHEMEFLKGAKNMLTENRIDFIQFEFGGCNIDSRRYFQDFWYFFKDKYRIYSIVKDGLFEIKNYKEECELFVTTNFLAEKKISRKYFC